MDSGALPYADALIKEYLLFRGFTRTLSALSEDLSQDSGCGYQAERLTELLFGRLIPACQMNQVLDLLDLLASRLYVHLDARFDAHIRKLEQAVIKCMLVIAIKKGRTDKVAEFFRQHGDDLLHGQDGGQWRPWCALAFIQQPWLDPNFQAFFLPEYLTLLECSFCNFLTEVTGRLPLPALLRFNTDRRQRLALQAQVEQLQAEVQRLQQKLASASGQHGSVSTKAVQAELPVGGGHGSSGGSSGLRGLSHTPMPSDEGMSGAHRPASPSTGQTPPVGGSTARQQKPPPSRLLAEAPAGPGPAAELPWQRASDVSTSKSDLSLASAPLSPPSIGLTSGGGHRRDISLVWAPDTPVDDSQLAHGSSQLQAPDKHGMS